MPQTRAGDSRRCGRRSGGGADRLCLSGKAGQRVSLGPSDDATRVGASESSDPLPALHFGFAPVARLSPARLSQPLCRPATRCRVEYSQPEKERIA
jgi:hypothetical protein